VISGVEAVEKPGGLKYEVEQRYDVSVAAS
jgi:hypothetical protein